MYKKKINLWYRLVDIRKFNLSILKRHRKDGRYDKKTIKDGKFSFYMYRFYRFEVHLSNRLYRALINQFFFILKNDNGHLSISPGACYIWDEHACIKSLMRAMITLIFVKNSGTIIKFSSLIFYPHSEVKSL